MALPTATELRAALEEYRQRVVAKMQLGKIASISVISPGSGYTAPPSVRIRLPDSYQVQPKRPPTPTEQILYILQQHLMKLGETDTLSEENKRHILRLAWECRHILPADLAVYAAMAGGTKGEEER